MRKLILLLSMMPCLSQAIEMPDFNNCRALPRTEREKCLLSLSARIDGDLMFRSPKIHVNPYLNVHHAMLTDGDSWDNVGQFFVSSLTPGIKLSLKNGGELGAEIPITYQTTTSMGDQGVQTYGRPEFSGLFPIRVSGLEWKMGFGLRFPYYEFRAPEYYSEAPNFRVWGLSLKNQIRKNLSRGWAWAVSSSVLYNTEYIYSAHEVVTDENNFVVWEGKVGHFLQYPISTKTELLAIKNYDTTYLSTGFLVQLGIQGRDISENKTSAPLIGSSMISAQFAYGFKIVDSLKAEIGLTKAIGKFYYDIREENFDDPTSFGDIGASLKLTGEI